MKRLFCCVLTAAMLLSASITSVSAMAFTDADEIVYTEAVEATTQLGLFAGSDGKFMPKGTVTRAQMATIIVKMLFGSGINADPFKGEGKFSDVADFEGGWAEGYINLCAKTGVVAGYGDGTFKPGQAVTTAEAVTMIINALEVDAGQGTWPNTVMAKAEEMNLFGVIDPKPETNVALIRDQLAVIVLAGVGFEPEGKKGYIVDGQLTQTPPKQEEDTADGTETPSDDGYFEFPAVPITPRPSRPTQSAEQDSADSSMLPAGKNETPIG